MAFKTLYTRLKTSASGNVTVELALIMSVLILVILYGVDFANMAIEKHRLEQFARAGTQYALLGQSEAQDEDGITAAIEAAAGPAADELTISLSNFCECPDGTSSDCDDECAGGDVPNLFLSIEVSRSYPYMFTFGQDLTGDVILEGYSSVRVR